LATDAGRGPSLSRGYVTSSAPVWINTKPPPFIQDAAKCAPADVTVIDPDLQWTVDVNKFYTRGRHSPFNGRQLKGKAVLTVVDGKIVMKDGVIVV